MQKLDRLKRLSFWRADLTDVGLVDVKKIASVRALEITDCPKVTDEGVMHIGEMVQLHELALNETRVTDAGVEHLQNLKSLEILDLSGTTITDRAIDTIVGMTQLQELGLSECSGLTAQGVRKLKVLRRLRQLSADPFRGRDDFSELYKALKHWDRWTPF